MSMWSRAGKDRLKNVSTKSHVMRVIGSQCVPRESMTVDWGKMGTVTMGSCEWGRMDGWLVQVCDCLDFSYVSTCLIGSCFVHLFSPFARVFVVHLYFLKCTKDTSLVWFRVSRFVFVSRVHIRGCSFRTPPKSVSLSHVLFVFLYVQCELIFFFYKLLLNTYER